MEPHAAGQAMLAQDMFLEEPTQSFRFFLDLLTPHLANIMIVTKKVIDFCNPRKKRGTEEMSDDEPAEAQNGPRTRQKC